MSNRKDPPLRLERAYQLKCRRHECRHCMMPGDCVRFGLVEDSRLLRPYPTDCYPWKLSWVVAGVHHELEVTERLVGLTAEPTRKSHVATHVWVVPRALLPVLQSKLLPLC